jgi:hypothetical protein
MSNPLVASFMVNVGLVALLVASLMMMMTQAIQSLLMHV